jgi:micrococcal nuclease
MVNTEIFRAIALSALLVLWAVTGAVAGTATPSTLAEQSDVDSTAVVDYTGDDDVIGNSDVTQAIVDWQNGGIENGLIVDIIIAWQRGTPVGGEDDNRGPSEGTEWNVTITRVIDGDTVEARFPNGETDTLRLLGVDTPETSYQSVSPDEFEGIPETTEGRDHLYNWGENAAEFANQTLENQEVKIEVDEQADRRGSFGRLLVYIYADGQNFNKQLLTDGYARLYESDFSERSAFESIESQAQNDEIGLWNYTTPNDSSSDSSLEIVEIHEDAEGEGTERDNLNDEYIVFENTNSTVVDLGGWTVEDEADHVYTFPDEFTLSSGETVTLHTGSGKNTDIDLYWGAEQPIWNNNGDTVIVNATDGTVVIEQSYRGD